MTTVPTLGYWDIRAFAQPIRYLLKYVGIEFNDKRYKFGSGNTLQEVDSIRKYWNPEKFTLGLDFPNLPFFIDGDVKITQSVTILRYLGRKYGLVANDEKSISRQDLVEQQFQDIKINFIREVILNQDFENKKKIFIEETLPQNLELLSKFLGDREWFVSDINFVDFLAYETLDWFRVFSPQCLDKYQNLTQFMVRFESLQPIADYKKSDEFKSWPILSPACKWGYWK